jgi:hypothetical protein
MTDAFPEMTDAFPEMTDAIPEMTDAIPEMTDAFPELDVALANLSHASPDPEPEVPDQPLTHCFIKVNGFWVPSAPRKKRTLRWHTVDPARIVRATQEKVQRHTKKPLKLREKVLLRKIIDYCNIPDSEKPIARL